MKNVKFIYNPGSGESKITQHIDDVIGIYQERGYTIIPHRLTFDGTEKDAIQGLDSSYHHILVAGGDGTVNYIVNLMKSSGVDIPLAILPTGTANDFASVIGMKSTNIAKACRDILDGKVHAVDLGKAADTYFINVFSCGLFTDISQKTPTKLKNTFGKLAYYMGGLGELTSIKRMPIKIESDGGNYDDLGLIFFVFNGKTAGKLKLAYLSEIDDGLLDVLIVKGENPIKTLKTLMHYLSHNSRRKKYPEDIVHIRCSWLEGSCENVDTTDIDGQPGPAFPMRITCEKGGLKILRPVPKTKAKRKAK